MVLKKGNCAHCGIPMIARFMGPTVMSTHAVIPDKMYCEACQKQLHIGMYWEPQEVPPDEYAS